MANNIANLPPVTGRILDENSIPFNIANFWESICSSGYETGATGGSTNISAATTPTFEIAVDLNVVQNAFQTVTLNPAGLTSGLLIASAMQTAIQALGGNYQWVTVAFTGGVYVITSGTIGPGSKVRIAAGPTNDVAATLKIGAANGAVDTDGKITGLPTQVSGSIVAQANLGTGTTVAQLPSVSPGVSGNARLHIFGTGAFDVQVVGLLNSTDTTWMVIPASPAAVPSGLPSLAQVTDVTAEGVYDFDVQGFYGVALNVVAVVTSVSAVGWWTV